MSLRDRLANIFQNNEYEQQPLQPEVNIPLYQMKEDGSYTSQPYTSDMAEKPVTLSQRLGNAVFGTPKYDVLATDDNGKPVYQQIGRQGGLLNDLSEGYRDNYTTGFAVGNLTPDKNKSIATRIGEGLGTAVRFLDSPLGRGLITAGLVGAVGGNGGQALGYGLSGAVGRQQYKAANDLYRQALDAQGVDTSNIGGNLTDTMYRQILAGKQLQDNADYRNLYLANQQRQNEIMNQIRADQLKRQQRQDEIQNQLAYSKLGLDQQKLNAYMKSLENKANKSTQDKAALKQINENASTLADIDAGLQLIEQNPQAYSWFKGKVGADVANRIDPKGVPTRTQIDNITAVYRKWLTGAQMSDAERKAYERFLPAPTDNAQIVKSKLQGMKNSIERKNQILMQSANMNNTQDNDPLGIL